MTFEENLKDPYVMNPTLTVDKKPWVQRCMVCLKLVDFIKMKSWVEYVRVGQFVRHKRCYLPSAK